MKSVRLLGCVWIFTECVIIGVILNASMAADFGHDCAWVRHTGSHMTARKAVNTVCDWGANWVSWRRRKKKSKIKNTPQTFSARGDCSSRPRQGVHLAELAGSLLRLVSVLVKRYGSLWLCCSVTCEADIIFLFSLFYICYFFLSLFTHLAALALACLEAPCSAASRAVFHPQQWKELFSKAGSNSSVINETIRQSEHTVTLSAVS